MFMTLNLTFIVFKLNIKDVIAELVGSVNTAWQKELLALKPQPQINTVVGH